METNPGGEKKFYSVFPGSINLKITGNPLILNKWLKHLWVKQETLLKCQYVLNFLIFRLSETTWD